MTVAIVAALAAAAALPMLGLVASQPASTLLSDEQIVLLLEVGR